MTKTFNQQVITYGPRKLANGDVITAEASYDDQCGNGHNSFSITGIIYGRDQIPGESTIEFGGRKYWCYVCGCCHKEIAEAFPELAPVIRWHLCSSDGPMHYRENARYWAGHLGYCDGKPNDPPNADHFRSTVVFGAVPIDENTTPWEWADDPLCDWLPARLPSLLEEFRKAVESLGFKWEPKA